MKEFELKELVFTRRYAVGYSDNGHCHPVYLMTWKLYPMKPVYSMIELSLN